MKYLANIFILLLTACASQTTPTGGPKDEEPPKLLKAIPEDQTLNFNRQTIELTFDEFVKVQKQKEQIIITPSIEGDYEIAIRKNKVTMEFPEPFEEKTTYTINFREAIQDITEGNPAENLKLTFSTGDYIDSLSVAGSVYDILGYKLAESIAVGLMRDIDSINIFNTRPLYFTRTDKTGNFQLDNIKPGVYKIYAFNDLNKNLKVDSRNEAYGFVDELIDLRESIDSLKIGLLKLDARELKVNSARQTGTFFLNKLSKGLVSYKLKFETNDSLYRHILTEHNSAIRIYPYKPITDSLFYRLTAIDSIGNKIDTTLLYKVDYDSRRIPENFEVKTEPTNLFIERANIEKTFRFNKPIKNINLDSIYLYVDSLTTIQIEMKNLQIDSMHNHIKLNLQLQKAVIDSMLKVKPAAPRSSREEVRVSARPTELYFGKGAFVSIENDSSKALKENPKQVKYDNTGTILIETNTKQNSFIIQVIDTKNAVVAESANTQKFTFRYLKPGDYRIRVLIDKNENGVWDKGDYFEMELPEPVYIYKSSEGIENIKLLANWEVGPLMLIF
jgi:uncharacterized protein (DUF2141 family)